MARELAAARAEGLGDDAADELLEEVREWTASAFGGPRSEWQKILMKIGPLGELLRANFGRAAASRVIVFVRYRANVTQLCNHLARHSADDGVKAHAFVGRSRRADLRGGGAAGMDQAEQLRVLRQFRGGEFNVLVATSVAEEGLDIGEVDLIVCFDSVTSPIRLMQRFGRTGRKMDGRCVLLLTQKEGREYRATIDAAERLAAELRYGSRVDMRPNASSSRCPERCRAAAPRLRPRRRRRRRRGRRAHRGRRVRRARRAGRRSTARRARARRRRNRCASIATTTSRERRRSASRRPARGGGGGGERGGAHAAHAARAGKENGAESSSEDDQPLRKRAGPGGQRAAKKRPPPPAAAPCPAAPAAPAVTVDLTADEPAAPIPIAPPPVMAAAATTAAAAAADSGWRWRRRDASVMLSRADLDELMRREQEHTEVLQRRCAQQLRFAFPPHGAA